MLNDTDMMILGGTDGELIRTELYSINFQEKKCTLVDDTYECNICFGKMAHKDGEVLVVGGAGSAGRNYRFSLKEKQWTLLEDMNSHTSVIG